MYLMKHGLVAALACGVIACGGGGGGDNSSSSGNYAGRWNFVGTKVTDDCRSPAPTNVTVSPLVNQDGTRIVVDSGSIVLTGNTTSDDGFLVSNSSGPDANGCFTATAYAFKNASDGNADVGAAIVVQCPSDGNRQCTISYGGPAVRQSNRTLTKAQNTNLADIQATISAVVVSGKGEVSQNTRLEAAETLADLVAPVK